MELESFEVTWKSTLYEHRVCCVRCPKQLVARLFVLLANQSSTTLRSNFVHSIVTSAVQANKMHLRAPSFKIWPPGSPERILINGVICMDFSPPRTNLRSRNARRDWLVDQEPSGDVWINQNSLPRYLGTDAAPNIKVLVKYAYKGLEWSKKLLLGTLEITCTWSSRGRSKIMYLGNRTNRRCSPSTQRGELVHLQRSPCRSYKASANKIIVYITTCRFNPYHNGDS